MSEGERSAEVQPAKPYELAVRPEYLEQIRSGQKTREVRINWPVLKLDELRPGDTLVFVSGTLPVVPTTVRAIVRYATLTQLFDHEPLEAIIPYVSLTQARQLAERLFPPDAIVRYGLCVVEFTPKEPSIDPTW